MLRRKKSDVLKELKDKVRYSSPVHADEKFYKAELSKIWKKLEEEQKYAESFDKSASYHRAIESERQAAGLAKLKHVGFVTEIMEIESVVVFCHHKAIHSLFIIIWHNYSCLNYCGQTDVVRQRETDRFQKAKQN